MFGIIIIVNCHFATAWLEQRPTTASQRLCALRHRYRDFEGFPTHRIRAGFALDQNFGTVVHREYRLARSLVFLGFDIGERIPVFAVIRHQQDFFTVGDFEQPARFLPDRAKRDPAQLGLVPDVVLGQFRLAHIRIDLRGLLLLRTTGNNPEQ